VVVYLPLDTRSHAKRFLNQVHPDLIVFVKYEIWPHFLLEAQQRNIKSILISALFRENQLYFKPYGGFMRKALFTFNHIFTQNLASKQLLEHIGYTRASVSGDTRFDRVFQQLNQDNSLPFVATFKQNNLCVVAGSTWPEDEVLFVEYIHALKRNDIKFILAPHTLHPAKINRLKNAFGEKAILFSERAQANLSQYQVLIVDTIGLLSKIYSYADLAYVGGAMGTSGLHNTLEPAVFGIPIVIGKNYKNFPEAHDMLASGGMLSVKNKGEFNHSLNTLLADPILMKYLGAKNFDYIKKNTGADIQILNYLRI